MNPPFLIRSILPQEAAEAAQLITSVAYEVMQPQMTLQEYAAQWQEWGILDDLEDVEKNYTRNGGDFLVVIAGGQLVGTGGFQRQDARMCMLRRVALLPAYRGQGLGCALMLELLRRAQALDYATMRLWTDHEKTRQAVALYRRLSFVKIHPPEAEENEIWMELALVPPG